MFDARFLFRFRPDFMQLGGLPLANGAHPLGWCALRLERAVGKGVSKGGFGVNPPLSLIFYKNFIIRECIRLDFYKNKGVRVEEYAYYVNKLRLTTWFDVELWRHKKRMPLAVGWHLIFRPKFLYTADVYWTANSLSATLVMYDSPKGGGSKDTHRRRLSTTFEI